MPLTANPISQWPVNNSPVDTFGLQDMSSVSPSGYTSGHIGQALIYDGIDDKSVIPHNAAYNFGDASTDSPFTLGIWVNLVDATTSRLMSKGVNTSNVEFLFSTSGGDLLNFAIYDQVSTVKLQRLSTATLTAEQGNYILLLASYDGSGLSSGIKLYMGNGSSITRLTTTDNSSGAYTAMHPLTGDIWVGGSQAFGGFLDGDGDVSYIFDYTLSDGGAAEGDTISPGNDVYFLHNGGAGIELTTAAGFQAAWARNANQIIGMPQ